MDQSPDAAGVVAPVPADPGGAAVNLAALNQKLDVLSVQANYLIEQAQETARRQRERSEFMRDALPIANDAINLLTDQLAEIQEYIDLSDILRVTKRMMRSGRSVEKMLDQLESLMDLAATVGPLANDMAEKVTDQLEVAEQRGYFALARGGAHAVDRVASSLTPGDLDCLANNAVVVLAAFQGLCQPVDTPSTLGLVKQMRDPDVRRGFAIVMRMLGALGARSAAREQAAAAAKSDGAT